MTTVTKHTNGHYLSDDGRQLYRNKMDLIRMIADSIIAGGGLVTHSAILNRLDADRPGHRTFPTEIAHALGKRPRKRQGQSVEVEGIVYPSIRAAAEAHGKPMETIRKRLISTGFPGWRRI